MPFLLLLLPKLKSILSYLLPIIAIVGAALFLYLTGYSNGEALVQAKWNQDKLNQATAIAELQNKISLAEVTHAKETNDIATTLSKVNDEHEKTVAAIKSDYASSLQQSEQRAEVYKRKAQSGTNSCLNLASYAARLDKSIEQGRELVAEFSATVKQRDEQIKGLSSQILADRALISTGNDHD